jgi:hypothetical protein
MTEIRLRYLLCGYDKASCYFARLIIKEERYFFINIVLFKNSLSIYDFAAVA